MLKKLFSALLALLMLFTLVPTALAEDEITIIDTDEEAAEPPAEAEDPDLIVLTEPNAGATITVQPQDVEIMEGGTAVFHVEAEADGVIGYRWQFRKPSGGEFADCSSGTGMDTDTYSLKANLYRNGYIYRCMILVNGFDSRSSGEAVLHITAAPGRPVISGPGKGEIVDVDAELNGTAEFRVSATGEDLHYQWQYRSFGSSTDKETGWYNCSGSEAKTPELHVQALQYRNYYMYRCKVYNSNSYEYSCYYRLIVDHMPEPPRITASGWIVRGDLGETVQFNLYTSGNKLRYQWYFRKNSEDPWSRCTVDAARSKDLRLRAYGYRNGYQYRCKVYNDGGSRYSEVYTLEVLPQDPPVIDRQPRDTTEMIGNTAHFFVFASGTNVKYQWQYQLPGSSVWSNSRSETAQSWVKSVNAYERRNGQRYRCKVYNGAGAVYTDVVTLTVVDSMPITIIRQPESSTTLFIAYLSVEAEGVSEFVWYESKQGTDYWKKISPSFTRNLPWVRLYRTPTGIGPETYEYRCMLTQGDTVVYTDIATVTYGVPES